ncbi:MAG: hypothetical protein K2Y37_14770 [Pirellulales bacterium]|nr:hypothetical protein [Pirellulales bacterium]
MEPTTAAPAPNPTDLGSYLQLTERYGLASFLLLLIVIFFVLPVAWRLARVIEQSATNLVAAVIKMVQTLEETLTRQDKTLGDYTQDISKFHEVNTQKLAKLDTIEHHVTHIRERVDDLHDLVSRDDDENNA